MTDHDDPPSREVLFDEQTLRADIIKVWGEHGAHIDVFDYMLRAALATRPEPDAQEQMAACLQARLPWPTADACATDLMRLFAHKGWTVAAAGPATPQDECGRWGCTLPVGHNRGIADIPENHRIPPPSREITGRAAGSATPQEDT